MVTTFNTKDMVQFSNWMMQRVKEDKREVGPNGDFLVTDADIQTWKFHKSKAMKVRAKYECISIEGSSDDTCTIHLSACNDGSPENKLFSKYTPSGNMTLNIDKDAPALALFKEDCSYYLDFSLAPEPV